MRLPNQSVPPSEKILLRVLSVARRVFSAHRAITNSLNVLDRRRAPELFSIELQRVETGKSIGRYRE